MHLLVVELNKIVLLLFCTVLPPFAHVSCTVTFAPFLPICCFLLEPISVELTPVVRREPPLLTFLSYVFSFFACFVALFKVCWMSSNRRDVGTSRQLPVVAT